MRRIAALLAIRSICKWLAQSSARRANSLVSLLNLRLRSARTGAAIVDRLAAEATSGRDPHPRDGRHLFLW